MSTSTSPARQRWREIIERQRASGLCVTAFCRRNGISASSLFAWKRRIASSLPSAVAPVFIEAKVADPPPAAPAADAIEVRLRHGRRVRVGRVGFDRGLLAEVVSVLEGLP